MTIIMVQILACLTFCQPDDTRQVLEYIRSGYLDYISKLNHLDCEYTVTRSFENMPANALFADSFSLQGILKIRDGSIYSKLELEDRIKKEVHEKLSKAGEGHSAGPISVTLPPGMFSMTEMIHRSSYLSMSSEARICMMRDVQQSVSLANLNPLSLIYHSSMPYGGFDIYLTNMIAGEIVVEKLEKNSAKRYIIQWRDKKDEYLLVLDEEKGMIPVLFRFKNASCTLERKLEETQVCSNRIHFPKKWRSTMTHATGAIYKIDITTNKVEMDSIPNEIPDKIPITAKMRVSYFDKPGAFYDSVGEEIGIHDLPAIMKKCLGRLAFDQPSWWRRYLWHFVIGGAALAVLWLVGRWVGWRKGKRILGHGPVSS